MPVKYYAGRTNFGLLPEPEGRSGSIFASAMINGLILIMLLYIGATAKRVIEEHKYEYTELIVPTTPPPPKVRVKVPPPPPAQEKPKLPEVKLDAPKIVMPKPKPEPKLPDVKME